MSSGSALFVVLVAAAAAACVCALRRLVGPERAAAVALVAAPAAYLVHALVDYNWDFLAVTAPTMVALGVLAGAGRDSAPGRRRPLLAAGVVLVGVVVLVSFSFPRLADRAERASTRALAAGDFEPCADQALLGALLQPALGRSALRARARRRASGTCPWRAERAYIHAVELQPDNPETWYTLGIFEFDVRENLCAAYRFLNNALHARPGREPVGRGRAARRRPRRRQRGRLRARLVSALTGRG